MSTSAPKDLPSASTELPYEPPTRRILERLDEPISSPGVCCVHEGIPCLLFDDWDYAEDWSGEFVRMVEPAPLCAAPRVSTEEFWALVRRLHTASQPHHP
jgi:hypothetical protein